MITEIPKWFIDACNKKLEKNCRKNEDSIPCNDWWEITLHREIDELIYELKKKHPEKPDPEKVLNEAADVANVAMLIARWHGGEAVGFAERQKNELP